MGRHIKQVTVTITRDRAQKAIHQFMEKNKCSYDHCVGLLKQAARNDRRPRQKLMAIAVLKQILL